MLRGYIFYLWSSDMIKGIADYLKKEKKVPAIQVLYEYFTALTKRIQRK
jgi:ring-1,2-phenylacetyl-CoA epoxidase subunit PaaE